MNLNKKIGHLMDNGLTPNFLSSLNEGQVTSLFNRLIESKKKEAKEQTTVTKTEKITTYTPSDVQKLKQGSAGVNVKNGEVTPTPEGGLVVRQQAEGEMKERFESKAQQGLFWARCNKCKSDDCKWCKMAKEFSKSTTKKEYKDMPEKIHPEKTVKYKKKETKEGYLDNVQKKLTDTYAKKFASFTPGLAWGGLEESLENMIEKHTQPTMKKRDLLKLIESEVKKSKAINEDFYFDEKEIDEQLAPTIEPGIKEPKIKPSTPQREPEWEPEEDEPIVPSPDTDPEPQAKEDKDSLMKFFKKRFKKDMERMDDVEFKPLKYKKF